MAISSLENVPTFIKSRGIVVSKGINSPQKKKKKTIICAMSSIMLAPTCHNFPLLQGFPPLDLIQKANIQKVVSFMCSKSFYQKVVYTNGVIF